MNEAMTQYPGVAGLQDAMYDTVHDFDGGAAALAPRFTSRRTGAMSPAVLSSKVDPKKDSHHLMLLEADRLMALTGDYRILHALALNHGHMALPIPQGAAPCDMAVLEMITQVWEAEGDVGRSVNHALSDRRIEPHEVEQVRRSAYRAQMALQQLVMRLEGMVDA